MIIKGKIILKIKIKIEQMKKGRNKEKIGNLHENQVQERKNLENDYESQRKELEEKWDKKIQEFVEKGKKEEKVE